MDIIRGIIVIGKELFRQNPAYIGILYFLTFIWSKLVELLILMIDEHFSIDGFNDVCFA